MIPIFHNLEFVEFLDDTTKEELFFLVSTGITSKPNLRNNQAPYFLFQKALQQIIEG